MNLHDYFKAKRGRQSALARALNVPVPDVCRWAEGKRPIPFKYGAPIESATEGEVTRQELFPDEWKTLWPELDTGNPTGLRRRKTDRLKRRTTDTKDISS